MKNIKTDKMKDEHQNSSLFQKNAVLPQLKRKHYKSNKRETLTIYRKTKFEIIMAVSVLLCTSFMLINNRIRVDENNPFFVLLIIVIIAVSLSTFGYSAYQIYSRKQENPDELSEYNELKASQITFISISVFLLLAATIFFVFMKLKSFTIYSNDCYWLILSFFNLHTIIKNFVFLKLEGGEEAIEEDDV